MPLDLFTARWVSVFWIVMGLSHALHPGKWSALLMPLRERDTGGLILGGMTFPIGLAMIMGHNVWVWGIPLIVTVAGWMATVKGTIYLLFPRAHQMVMASPKVPERGFRIIGIVMVILGAIVGFDAFVQR